MSDDVRVAFTVCRTPDEWAAILPAWRAFVAGAGVRGGFWCDPAVIGEMVGFDGGERAVLAVVSLEKRPVAMLPFRLTVSPVPLFLGLLRLGSVRAAALRLPDGEFAVQAGRSRSDTLAAVLDAFREQRTADVVFADNCSLEGDMTGAAWRGRRAIWRNRQPTYLVDLPADFDAYLAGLSPNTRQTLRRRVRHMRQECGDALQARCYGRDVEMEELRGHLVTVWKASWHGKLNRQPPPALPFLRSMAGRGWLRSYVLFAGDAPVASVLGFQYRGTFLDEAPAYDDRWGRSSPGLVLNYYIMEDLFRSDPPRVVDFGFGYNQYKEMLGTRRETRGQLWLPLSRRGQLLVGGMRACDGLYGLGKRILGGTCVLRKLKSRIRSRR